MGITELFAEGFKGALTGKAVIVTGAGRGCGRAIAEGFARVGAKVCCLSRSIDEITDTVARIEERGGSAMGMPTDVSDLASVEASVAIAVERFGGCDILVLSHGVALGLGPIELTDPAEWRHTIEVNLLGAYHCVRSVVPHMKARGRGKIITVGSGQGHRPTGATAAYASSKAGLWGLTQALGAELADHNISVNELVPGNVKTRLYDETFERTSAATAGNAPSLSEKRAHEWLKSPEDVVPLALFIACQPDVGPSAQSFSLMRRF